MMRTRVPWRRILVLSSAMLILAGSSSCMAEGFALEMTAPKARIRIPGIPQMKLETHPQQATHPHLRFFGSKEPYTLAVSTPAAAAGMTPLECAGAISRTLAARPGAPPPAQILKARLNERTFVAIYATPLVGAVQLHAHLLSAAGGKHCIEVHATKISISEDELPDWVTELENAGIEAD